MLFVDLTPDRSASEDHTSHPEIGNIRIKFELIKPLPEAITCLLYVELDNSLLVDFALIIKTDF